MIVVEINAFLYKDNDLPTDASNRMFIDNIPFDEVKDQFIKDTYEPGDRLEYYLPLIKYHGSWEDYPWKFKFLLTDLKMRYRGYSIFRGYKTVANQFIPTEETKNDKLADDESTKPLAVAGQRYLIEMLDYLKENNINNVVFTRFPHIVNTHEYSRFQRCNEAANIIKSYGYDFINFERYADQLGFDVEKDFYNWDHLNIYGAEKLTNFLGKTMVRDYGVVGSESELSEQQKAEWQDSVDHYYMIYHYCDSLIHRRNSFGNASSDFFTITEDENNIERIEDYAKEHPEKFTNN